jgi:hypothetical protein
MGTKPCTFRKRDVQMAIRAVKDGGCEPSSVRITRDGTIVVGISNPGEQALAGETLQEELGKWSP